MENQRRNGHDNVEKMQEMIEDTQERMASSENYIKDNDVTGEQKARMEEKNEHRKEAIANWQEEIREETNRR